MELNDMQLDLVLFSKQQPSTYVHDAYLSV